MDRFNDAIWKTLEDRVEEMSKKVGQPQQAAPRAGPPQRTIRGRFFTEDPPPRGWLRLVHRPTRAFAGRSC
jgi:hypothetical protein